jgi:hypothetical protein
MENVREVIRLIGLTVLLLVIVFTASVVMTAFGQQFAATTPSGALTACPAPVSGSNILCSVTDGYYASVAGASYVKISATAGGVASFNGRSGAVAPAAGDYSYSQLSGLPTTLSCATVSVTNSGLVASGCTIK